jgi:signal transduction histidine kinase
MSSATKMKPFWARELLARVRTNVELGRMREEAVQRAQQHIAQLQGLYEVSLAVNSTLSPQAVLQLIGEQARALMGARYALTSFTEQSEWAQALVTVSVGERQDEQLFSPAGVSTGVLSRLQDQLAVLRRHYEAIPQQSSSAWLEAPLLSRDGHEIGSVQLANKVEGEFTEEDSLLFLQLAEMTSLALENARLYEAAKDTIATQQRHDELTTALIVSVTQELQTSLKALSNYLEISRKGLQALELSSFRGQEHLLSTRKEGLQDMMDEAQRAQELIGQLQDVAQLERGTLTLSPASAIDLVRVARQEVALLRERAPEHHMTVLADSERIMVEADEVRIRQVLRHLLNNAIAVCPVGKLILVEITTNTQGDEVVVCVQDEGLGLSPEDQEHAFDRWYWASKKREGHGSGLGLGLYLSSAIIRQHGGRIWLKSVPGQGNRFYFSLPTQPARPHET